MFIDLHDNTPVVYLDTVGLADRREIVRVHRYYGSGRSFSRRKIVSEECI